MNAFQKLFLGSLLFFSFSSLLRSRSIHRPYDPCTPIVKACWKHDQASCFYEKKSHLERYPTFAITVEDSYQYSLPETITVTELDGTTREVQKDAIDHQINTLLQEIDQKKTRFTYFVAIHKRDFNRRKKCGLIVLKFREYPLILKLSIEYPESFVNPYCKGIVPMFFFFMSGGANRHLTGLTRIRNMHSLREKLALLPQWEHIVKTPNKWLWLPGNTDWIEVTGYNIGDKQETLTTQLPSVYGIIADAIDVNDSYILEPQKRSETIMKLCNDLNLMIDPHENNYVFHYDPARKHFTITIIDTEHFPTMVGLPPHQTAFTNHSCWYKALANKCLNDMFFRSKRKRRAAQHTKESMQSCHAGPERPVRVRSIC